MGTIAAIAIGLFAFFLGMSNNGLMAGILFGGLMFAMAYGAFVWRPTTSSPEAKFNEKSEKSVAPGITVSSEEQRVVGTFSLNFMELGISEPEALETSTRIVTEVLADLKSRGVDPFKRTQGDDFATIPLFTEPRLAEGLTLEDIRNHWNRPMVFVLSEIKVREMMNFVYVDVARLQGRDTSGAAAEYKRTFPRYGDPRQWNPAETFNLGLRPQDAEVFLEFAERVDSWRRRIGELGAKNAIDEYGTMNAAIRAMVSKGQI